MIPACKKCRGRGDVLVPCEQEDPMCKELGCRGHREECDFCFGSGYYRVNNPEEVTE